MIALSTSWKSKECRNGEKLAQAVVDTGFKGIELEYRIDATMFRQMLPALQRSGLKVVSVHNYFPIPPILSDLKGGGDLFLLSHPDRKKRLEAIKWTTRTIQHAGDLGALAVVLHCGRVDMAPQMDKLRDFFNTGRIASEEARTFIDRKLQERDRIKPKYMDSLRFSMNRLIPAAQQENIILGLENRYHYHELPGPDDFETLFAEFSGAPLGYWHDTGHAHANERLGITAGGEMLKRYADCLVGIHLHDAIGLEDHFAPGKGEIDFEAVRPLLTEDMPAVVELKPGTREADVSAGLRFVRQLVETKKNSATF
ncbi:MAG: sugar phosphate isomerase/epimerase [Deltaproteobacteria bacterium]|jgi:sugar phosphate isomerase/epimerase|nr:sugar phosphate isomerase/epimerase [Deltaproteobacteria bacterium]